MSELVRRTTGVVDPAEAARLSKSKLMPEHLANDPASAEYMMRFGASLGLEPVAAFQHIYVFPGKDGRLKAGMSAHLMHALALAAGHTIHIEANAAKATAVLVRKTSDETLQRFQWMREEERRQKLGGLEDLNRLYTMQRGQILERIEDLRALASFGEDPADGEITDLRKQLAALHAQYDFASLRDDLASTKFDLTKLVRFESVWTMGRAAQITMNGNKLVSKDVWQNFGQDMLVGRTKTGVVRLGAPDVILGVKNILGEMGLVLSEDHHDNLAMASALYTPEELGAEVNRDGVPLQGEVIDVTRGGSRKQDRLVDLARNAVSRGSADSLAAWADNTSADQKLTTEAKIARVSAVQEAAREAGKSEEPVVREDRQTTLAAHLEAVVTALHN